MSRAVVFIFPSSQPISVKTIAICAKAIAEDLGIDIRHMVGKQLDENDIATAIVSGIRIGEAEVCVDKTTPNIFIVMQGLGYINQKFNEDLVTHKSLTNFVANLSMYVSTIQFTGSDNTMLAYLRKISTVDYSELNKTACQKLGITKSVYEVIQKVAAHV